MCQPVTNKATITCGNGQGLKDATATTDNVCEDCKVGETRNGATGKCDRAALDATCTPGTVVGGVNAVVRLPGTSVGGASAQ